MVRWVADKLGRAKHEHPANFPGCGKYDAEIYADASDAASNATHTSISTRPVDRTTVLDIHMVSGGGNAIWIHPAKP